MKSLHYYEKTAHADTLGQDALFLILRLLCRMSTAALSAAVDAIISRKPLLLSGGTTSAATTTPNASRSSGGGPGEALLLEKRLPPEHLRIVIHAACLRRLCQPPWTRSLNIATLYPSGGTPSEEAAPKNASYSSGGGPGEALLLEKRPPPAFSPLTETALLHL